MDSVACSCDDWSQNIPLVNAPHQLLFARTGAEYHGKKFSHCPWCGSTLRQKQMPGIFGDADQPGGTP